VILAAREWLSGAGANITRYGLAKYILTLRAKNVVQDALNSHLRELQANSTASENAMANGSSPSSINTSQCQPQLELKYGPRVNRIRARTARNWLHKLGLSCTEVKKGVYIHGHERVDVVSYRLNIFIPRWHSLVSHMVIFHEDGRWELPPTMFKISL
jgi:hypothetical protein